ncbi:MAG TPA: DNA-directed RNA polymerase subunit omega [Acidobacteriota bacterium]|jgi:DNA-directed RNA polymerase subunit omega|nr:DNA-directed RNA polymerase subunit omega [Acidobacteriota bacterium]HRR55717.1 DNA-directed RNA polymerase subunit omega [Acidobacteriota bacterium]HRV07835.1 DNA-directed RNA polymerase subunit omega [Acidobacteriota bacterium]
MVLQIPKEFDSKFRFVLVAAERAKQIQAGAPPKIDVKSKKPAYIAIKETEAGLVEWDILEVEEEGAEAAEE